MLNQCQFIGHLGADPDVKRSQDGRPIVNLSLGVTEKWRSKDTGEQKQRTEWVSIVIFSEGLAKIAEQYLKKGSKIMVIGKMQTRSWDQDGVKRFKTEIVLQGFSSVLLMLDSRTDSQPNTGNEYGDQSSGRRSAPPGNYEDTGRAGGDIDDEIPFICEWRA